jgi:CubicO group peptidase (beta-lactamase class C family)
VEDSIIQVVRKYLDWEGENGFSGVVLVKTPDNQPVIQSYGFANREQGIRNDPDVAFNIGAITKQFTGAAILKLRMMGKLNLTDTIGSFFPDFTPEFRKITVHRLLTHSAGLPPDIGSPTEVITRDELINRLKKITPAPGNDTVFIYSHTGYNLLGLIIENASGMDYESFLQQHLFRPAGMERTGYRLPDWRSTVVAHGYSFCNDWGRPMDFGWLDDGPSWSRRASGGMLSTANDLFAWHQALLGDKILDAPSKSLFYYPEPSVPCRGGHSGYGWMVLRSNRNTDLVAHNGWNGRFYADFLRYLKEDVTIILLSNCYRDGNHNMPFELAEIVFKYPDPPRLMGRLTVCYDSLPENRLGQLAGEFFTLMANGSANDFKGFIETGLANHLINKFGPEPLADSLINIQKQSGSVKFRQIRVYDNRKMFLDVILLKDNSEASFMLNFDENEDYKIRGIVFKPGNFSSLVSSEPI